MFSIRPKNTAKIFWLTSLKEMWNIEIDLQFAMRDELKSIGQQRLTTQVLLHSEKLKNRIYFSCRRVAALDTLIQNLAL